MNSNTASKLFLKYSNAMAYVDVELPNGDRSIGSAFHIGEGVFVTARHVLEGNKVAEIKITEPVAISTQEMIPDLPLERIEELNKTYTKKLGFIPSWKHWINPLLIEKGPFYPKDPRLDLAVFKVANIHPAAGVIILGRHWDDWIYRYPWVLSEAIIMGYPPIPLTNEPYLIAAKAEIHTYIYLRNSPSIHFILSATPRGGFSGGAALHEGDFALGVITSGLVENNAPPETGFLAVLSVESIHKLLEETNLMPECQNAA
jgi:hypothetical protein